MASLHWLTQTPGRVQGVIHINHGTDFSVLCQAEVGAYCAKLGLPILYGKINNPPPPGRSKEDYWREGRYSFFKKWCAIPIVTCHTLDDCIEEYVINKLIRFSEGKVIRYYGPCNTIRPFRTWKKSDIYAYCERHSVPYVDDPSNIGNENLRARLRSEVVPAMLDINPGMYRQVARLVTAG